MAGLLARLQFNVPYRRFCIATIHSRSLARAPIASRLDPSSAAHALAAPINNNWQADLQSSDVARPNIQPQRAQQVDYVKDALIDVPMSNETPKTSNQFNRTFYRRVLPSPPAIHFASTEGKQLFAEALLDGTAAAFFKLIEHFRTQDEPAFCGLASLAMVLNSLAIDPRRPWKGPWRYYHEQMLDCCHPLSKVVEEGVTLQQVACLARCNGAAARMCRHNEIPLSEFRDMIDHCSQIDNQYLIVSYSRKAFLQTGDGHFSPIGAYHRERDLVLILDTARFKYPPHWVPLTTLYEAMAPLDPATQLPRGMLLVSHSDRPNSVLFTLDRRKRGYDEVSTFLSSFLPATVARYVVATAAYPTSFTPTSLQQLLVEVLLNVPSEAQEFLACRSPSPHDEGCPDHEGSSCHPVTSIKQLLHELRAMELYKQLQAAVDVCHDQESMSKFLSSPFALERAALLLLMAKVDTWDELKDSPQLQPLLKMLQLAPGSNVAVEVEYVQQQLQQVPMLEHDSALAAAQCTMCASDGCHACHY